MIRLLCSVLTILFYSTLFFGQNIDKEIIKKIDELYSPISNLSNPGGVVLIAQKGKILYSKAFGKANLEFGVDIKIDHKFRIASNTKPFTACAILKLAEDGKLSLQDNITKYLKNYPTHGYSITIENLLTHTSGIKDFNAIKDFRKNEQTDFIPSEFINLFKDEPLEFEPGTKWSYSNSGYFLLGYIIEKVSNKRYSEYLETTFFKPLGIKHTLYDNPRRIIKNRVNGYVPSNGAFLNGKYITMTYPYSAGSLLSTVEDLHAFYKALFSYEILSEKSLKKATTPYILKNGAKTPTGYSWFLGNISGEPVIEHSGGITGFYSSIVYCIKEDLFITALTNCNWSFFDFENSTKKVASIVLDKEYFNKQVKNDNQKEYEGVYENKSTQIKIIKEGSDLSFVRDNGSKFLLYNFEVDKIYNEIEFSTYQFVRNQKGKIKGLMLKRTGSPVFFNKTNKKLPKKSIYRSIRLLAYKNADEGIKRYHYLKKVDRTAYSFNSPNELNNLGYDFLNKKQAKNAIKIFQLLVSEFPENANSYDSLAEAYYHDGQKKLSLLNYRKSLELNNQNKNAKIMRHKIISVKK
ncbi:MAG: serine hydrolase [Cellulophaga sp.]